MIMTYDKFSFNMDNDFMNQRALFIAVSGSHAFGWNNDESDLDVRIVFCPNLGQLISPFYKCKTKEWMDPHGGVIKDFCMYPIDHYLTLLNKGNGNALDNLFEPHLYEDKIFLPTLQKAVREHLHIGFVDHCIGYSRSVKKDFSIPSRVEHFGYQKLLLERYRELLKGKLLLKNKIEYNLSKMFEQIATAYGEPILESCKKGKASCIDEISKAMIETDKLEEELIALRDESKMPTQDNSSLMLYLDRWIKSRYVKLLYGEKALEI